MQVGNANIEWLPFGFDNMGKLMAGWKQDETEEIVRSFVKYINGGTIDSYIAETEAMEAYRTFSAIINFLALTRLASLSDTSSKADGDGGSI